MKKEMKDLLRKHNNSEAGIRRQTQAKGQSLILCKPQI